MTKNTNEMPPLGVKLTDIYYVLFRHKWLIAGFIAAGLLVAVTIYFTQRSLYWSEAKLLVRYVVDTKSMESAVGTQVQQPTYGGEAIINSELEILTSFDLCEEVARLAEPEKVLGKNGGSNVTAAASMIYKGLTVENPRRSNIIKVRLVHPDPSMSKVILQHLIDTYFKRHVKLHRTASDNDSIRFLQEQANQLLNRIRQNEEEERKLRLRQQLFETEAQLAEFRPLLGGSAPSSNNQKEAVAVNTAPETIAEYKMVSARLDAARNREMELTIENQYTDEHPLVKAVRQQAAEYDRKKKALEAQNPRLATVYVPPTAIVPATPDNRADLARALSLEARMAILTNQLALVYTNLAGLANVETDILDVQRKLQLDRQNYLHIAAGLEAAQFDQALTEAKLSNIQPVQTPSPPAPNVSQRLKFVLGAFFGFLAAGLVLAFLIEFLVDHSVRRPGEFESKLQMPLFLSIPKFGLNGHAKLLPLPAYSTPPAVESNPGEDLNHTWAEDHPLRPYIDGLRDRTLIHFEGDPHKPKLVGVTSCGQDAGVTSLAAGLAGALSETGDGNVLLMNLNFDAQSVHPFYRGELASGLADALEIDKRRNSPVLQNLYVATASGSGDGDNEPQNLSKQLARVVPKLRVSDYDYIIFDLPPTTPTTITARLAGMMDLVILVVQAEKDTQETVKQAGKLLARSKARVSAVLNKVRNPVPQWLHKGARL